MRLAAATLVAAATLPGMIAAEQPASGAGRTKDPGLQLMGNRFLTFSTVVRVRQIEMSRDEADQKNNGENTPRGQTSEREALMIERN